MKKILMTALALIMAFSSLTGCKKAEEDTANGEVVLKWIMPGPGEQQDSQKVWDEFNKLLKTYEGMENVTVDIEVIPAADYKQKFMLMQTSGEKVDIIQTYSLSYADESRNGTFMPLDELLEETPDLKAALPDWFWKYGVVDGQTYVVPNYQVMGALESGIRTSQENIDKYWDEEKATKLFQSKEFFDEECLDYVEEYLAKLKEAGEIDLGAYLVGPPWKGYEVFLNPFGIKRNVEENGYEVINIYREELFKTTYKKMREWYEKGYIRKDSLSAKSSEDQGTKDGLALWFGPKHTDEYEKSQFAYDVGNISIDDKYYIQYNNAAGGNGISVTCKHPKEAIKLLELMNSEKGKELYNMLCFGLEGVHYAKEGEDRIRTFYDKQQPTSSEAYGLWIWVVGNTYNAYNTQYQKDDHKYRVFEVINQGPDSVKSKLTGFYPDNKKYQSKLGQLKAICNEYKTQLISGALENWEEVYEEFLDKMEKCGEAEIRESLQEQIDEFVKTKK